MPENIAQKALIGVIRFYQQYISPRKKQGSCRFRPTCSQYAVEAIQLHGAIKGSALAFWRILRCNPFNEGGIDPVPGSDWARRLQSESREKNQESSPKDS